MKFGVIVFLLFLTGVAYADQGCLQSFNVDVDKSVSSFAWLPGAPIQNMEPMNCRSLELVRQAYFLKNEKLIDVTKLGQVKDYEAEIESSLATIKKNEADLQKKLAQDAALDSLRITYRVLMYEFAKASTLISCFAPEPTASKVVCAIGLVKVVEDTASVLDGTIAKTEISEGAKEMKARGAELRKKYEQLKQREPSFDMSLAQKEHSELFLSMCQAIRSNCL